MTTKTFVPAIWENPEIQGINRLPMRSPLLPFSSEKDALAEAIAGPEYAESQADSKNSNYKSLDGQWNFKLVDNPYADEEAGANCTGAAFGIHAPAWTLSSFKETWPEIKVPGTWTRQGYDKPHYTNVQMPFQGTPPNPPEHNPTGLYRRTFTLPADWQGKRVVLHIGSAESVCLVYVNGVFVGAGKDTRLPGEYDITRFLTAKDAKGTEDGKEAVHTLCLKVVRYSDASYIEDQDQWWYGGIHRSVYLYATENCYIEDARAIPGGSDGKLQLEVTLGGDVPEGKSIGNEPFNMDNNAKPFTISYALYPFTLPASREDALAIASNAKPLVQGEMSFACNYRLNSNRAEAEIKLDNPKIWSHEEPNLYVLAVNVSREGKSIGHTAFCTAFREVRVAKRELLINGKAVLIKGVNRHEHDEYTGKTLSVESMKKDIVLLKQHNFNAVRTCHYPDDERWYDLCDRYGIYLVDEANIEHHAFYKQLAESTAWTAAYIARMERMVERDKNHPSIIIWSLGNESGDGANHALTSAWIHQTDPSRPVNYEGAVRPENGQGGFTLDSLNRGRHITDIIGPMYPRIDLITDFTKYRDDDRPLIMIEFSHAMGNSNGSLADYWHAIETHRGLQGGFIWEWIDHGLASETKDGVKYWKYGGDFGDEPSDYDFCCDGLLFPDQTPKPAMAECKQLFAPVRLTPAAGKPCTYIVENRYDFTPLGGVELRWELRSADATLNQSILASGTETLPDIAPGECAEITLTAASKVGIVGRTGTVYLHADFCLKHDTPCTPAGFVIAQAEQILHETSQLHSELRAGPSRTKVQTNPAVLVTAETVSVWMRPSLFRVPTQNDGMKTYFHLLNNPAARFYYREKAVISWIDLDLLHMRCVNGVLLAGEKAAKGFEDTKLGAYSCVVSEDAGQGFIVEIEFDLDPALPELPKVGVTAKIPARYGKICWLGAGPHESYPDRIASAFLGCYEDSPASLEVPYIVPQDNGNRSGVRAIKLIGTPTDSDAPGVITIVPETPVNMSVSRYTQENLFAALHTCDLVDTTTGNDGYYLLNIDIAQRGVGTATCGPDTLERYRIRPGVYKMRLYVSAESD